ncbi:hypothetical protein [Rhodococcus pyridinivorans]|uniref:hypothetical protein n=1 Tax=Rhodococcus pyridinivorans TaxID=103816 RepID=UPI003AAEEC17
MTPNPDGTNKGERNRTRLERELALLADVRRRIAASEPTLRIPTTTVDRILDEYLQLPQQDPSHGR